MSVLSTSSLGTTSATNLAVSGLVSGIDTGKVIEGLLAIEQSKITRIDARKSRLVAEQTAFKGIEARLLALQVQMTQMSRSQNGVFDARAVTSSNEDALTAAATSSAVAGTYRLRVNSLARPHLVASQGFDAVTSQVTTGTMQIQVGDASTSITIDGTNNTLEGVARAINESGAAVTASVINDGGGEGKQAYRLMLAANASGTENRITITNKLAASGGGAVKPSFDANAISTPIIASGTTGTSVVQSNAGAGYTGTTNNAYQFTVIAGGTVGVDNNLQIAYTDSTGTNTGTLTVNSGDVNNFLAVAQGIQVQFASGTLVAGDRFQVKAFVPTIQDAVDASVTLGSGSGALQVTSSDNQIDSLVPGVAINLLQSNPAEEITLTVGNDVEKMKKSIEDFVTSFNDLMKYIDDQSRFDSQTNQAGILLGNRQATTIQDQVRSVLTGAVEGANSRLNYIGALGITVDDSGKLVINDSKLSDVLEGRRPGVTVSDVKTLFALTGSISNPNISFVTGSTKTKASSTPYTLNISQAAEKAALTATTALAATTVLDGSNNTFTVGLDGKTSALLTIAPGSYTRTALAQALQAAINGDETLNGASVNVSVGADLLTLSSNRFGLASQVGMQSGTALAALGFVGGAAAQGRDVVGNFTVNGVTEAALGSGTFLTGVAGNANTADLQLNVTLTPTQVGAGLQADVNVRRGIASRLDQVLSNVFDPVTGRMKTIADGLEDRIEALDEQKSKQSEIMASRTASLQRQFASMERVLSQLQSAGGFLSQQASNLTQS